jgi:hypothetical protein
MYIIMLRFTSYRHMYTFTSGQYGQTVASILTKISNKHKFNNLADSNLDYFVNYNNENDLTKIQYAIFHQNRVDSPISPIIKELQPYYSNKYYISNWLSLNKLLNKYVENMFFTIENSEYRKNIIELYPGEYDKIFKKTNKTFADTKYFLNEFEYPITFFRINPKELSNNNINLFLGEEQDKTNYLDSLYVPQANYNVMICVQNNNHDKIKIQGLPFAYDTYYNTGDCIITLDGCYKFLNNYVEQTSTIKLNPYFDCSKLTNKTNKSIDADDDLIFLNFTVSIL